MYVPRLLSVLSALLLSSSFSQAQLQKRSEMHVFTDTDGKQLSAVLLDAGETWISVKLNNGRKAQINLARLSLDDQTFVAGWVAAREAAKKQASADESAKKRAADIPVKLVEFCKSKLGQQVGNGECWTLADEAFKACGLERPGNEMRVWGRLLDLKKEKAQPGDIVEYRSAKFRNGSYTGPEHTSIVVKAGRKSLVTIAEQNWGGKKIVHEAELDPDALVSGVIMVYRPE